LNPEVWIGLIGWEKRDLCAVHDESMFQLLPQEFGHVRECLCEASEAVTVEDAGDSALPSIEFESSPFAIGKDLLELMHEANGAGGDGRDIISIGKGAGGEWVGVSAESSRDVM